MKTPEINRKLNESQDQYNSHKKHLSSMLWVLYSVITVSFRKDRQDGIFPKIKDFIQKHLSNMPITEKRRVTQETIERMIAEIKSKDGIIYRYPPIHYIPYIIAVLIQFTDETYDRIPKYIRNLLPHKDQIIRLENYVLSVKNRITVWEILEKSLEITNNNLYEALLLAALTTRWRARLSDQCLFGPDRYSRWEEIKGPRALHMIEKWWSKLIPFEGADVSPQNPQQKGVIGDVGGDYYYFFTSALLGYLSTRYSFISLIAKGGAKIMRAARRLAGPGTVSVHEPAATWGYEFGISLFEEINTIK